MAPKGHMSSGSGCSFPYQFVWISSGLRGKVGREEGVLSSDNLKVL